MAWRIIHKSTVTVIGFGVIALGVALLVLPGPGILTIAGGIAILATQYHWARRLLEWFKERYHKALAKDEAEGKNRQ